DLAPCQGATQGAVHSPGDGGDDVIESGGDRGPLRDAIVLAQAALHAVDHRRRHLPQVGVPVAVLVLQTGSGDVLEVGGHGFLLVVDRSCLDARTPPSGSPAALTFPRTSRAQVLTRS